jgi:hypothetical protein
MEMLKNASEDLRYLKQAAVLFLEVPVPLFEKLWYIVGPSNLSRIVLPSSF